MMKRWLRNTAVLVVLAAVAVLVVKLAQPVIAPAQIEAEP